LTVDELLDRAMTAHRQKDLSEAADLYGAVLARDSRHSDALHYLGLLLHQRGESEDGASLIERSLEVAPRQPDALNNLGNIRRLLGDDEEALRAYWTAVKLDAAHSNAWSNMAVIHRNRDEPQTAEKMLKIALAFDPENFAARHSLGLTYVDMEEFERAEETIRALIREGRHEATVALLYANILNHFGRPDQALNVLMEWREKDPANPVVAHHLEAQRGANPAAASDAYIRQTFDGFAGSFDGVLKGLDYAAPAAMAELISVLCAGREIGAAVDLGCGTGLLGPLLKPGIAHLTGVDLSPNMLARARAKGVYDALVEEEIVACLNAGTAARFDLATAAEVLNYCGDLQPVFDAVARALKPGGLFVATHEILPEKSDPGYRLLVTGRFAQAAGYVEAVAIRAGLAPRSRKRIPLRKEFGSMIEGIMTAFGKPV